MEIIEIIKNRNSIRNFKPIEINNIDEIIKLAQSAPSAGGRKSYSFDIVTEKSKIMELAGIAHQSWISEASLIVIVKDEPNRCISRYGERAKIYSIQDATIFLSYIDLLCVNRGLATCWVGAFNIRKLSALTMLVVGGKN